MNRDSREEREEGGGSIEGTNTSGEERERGGWKVAYQNVTGVGGKWAVAVGLVKLHVRIKGNEMADWQVRNGAGMRT